MKRTKCPAKEKNKYHTRKENGEGKRESKLKEKEKVKNAVLISFKPKNYLKILLPAHACTLKANILNMD